MGIYINNNGVIERKDGAPGPAGSIAYDNSESGLVSTNVQNAIDEVNERVIENISDNASIELTATAAHAHAVGTSFMLIGQLVKTTSAIEVGDTIAVGTNVEPTSVLDLLGDVNTALAELNSNLIVLNHKKSVSVVGDGVKTYRQILNTLFSLIDSQLLNANSYLSYSSLICHLAELRSTRYQFKCYLGSSGTSFTLRQDNLSDYATYNLFTQTEIDHSTDVVDSGTRIILYY